MVDLTFTEAAKGVNKTIHLEMLDTCPRCGGKGSEPEGRIAKCAYCGGTGTVSFIVFFCYFNRLSECVIFNLTVKFAAD